MPHSETTSSTICQLALTAQQAIRGEERMLCKQKPVFAARHELELGFCYDTYNATQILWAKFFFTQRITFMYVKVTKHEAIHVRRFQLVDLMLR
jgi:hypothetical protein